MKVVINKCYGVFRLSKEVYKYLGASETVVERMHCHLKKETKGEEG